MDSNSNEKEEGGNSTDTMLKALAIGFLVGVVLMYLLISFSK